MEYITLHNGMQMPLLGFGTFQNTGEDCEKSVYTAIQSGYRLIDTAQAYGNEKQVGKAIKASGIERNELFIVTKVNFPSYDDTEQVVLESLEKLGTSYVDLVLLHWPFGNRYAAWRTLEKLQETGSIKAIGISNFEPDQMIDLIHFNKVIPVVNQIETNLYCQRQQEHQWLQKYGVAHMAYAPLGQGHRNEMFAQPEIVKLAKKYEKTAAQMLLRFFTQ